MTIVIHEVTSNKASAKPDVRIILDKDEHWPPVEAVKELIAKAAVNIPDSIENLQIVRLETKE